tara:strand:- start:213 stop:362 length:150 start_codon:yes stop_codon:yes gene_type:complete
MEEGIIAPIVISVIILILLIKSVLIVKEQTAFAIASWISRSNNSRNICW